MKFEGHIFDPQGSLVVVLDGKQYMITKSHVNYQAVIDAFKANDPETFLEKLDVTKTMQTYISPEGQEQPTGITIDGENIYYRGQKLEHVMVDAIVRNMREGFECNGVVRLLERLMTNCSSRVIRELYPFLEKYGLSITGDGCFLAYKCVDANYMDKYSGSICNRPGEPIPAMERNQVDDDYTVGCGRGYHAGALPYAGPGGYYHSEGNKVIIVKIAPENVVSVPEDCDHQKLRMTHYEVVGDFQGELKSACYSGKVGGNYASEVTPRQVYGEMEEYQDRYDNDWEDENERNQISLDNVRIGQEYEFDVATYQGDMLFNVILLDIIQNDNTEFVCEDVETTDIYHFKKEDILNVYES